MRCAIMLLWLLGACAERHEAAPRAEALAPRLVSLHDVTTEIVVAVGAADHFVGVAELVDVTPDVERAVAHVPRVGSLESILALRPDVVVGFGVVAEQDPELVRRLRERGVDVHLDDPSTVEDVYAMTRAVAQRAGARLAGERVSTTLRARIDRARASAAPARPLRVFVYDCCDPPFTAGGRTVLNGLIERAGGHNVFAELDAGWTHVSWEEVVARRPELVVLHSYRYEGQGDLADKRRMLRALPTLSNLPTAVLPLGCSIGGLRSAEGLERLRTAMGASS